MAVVVTDSSAPLHPVRIASSRLADTRSAVNAVLDEVAADSAALVFVFYSPQHDDRAVAEILGARAGTRGIGGSTAGELSPDGFQHGSIVAFALHGDHVSAAISLIPNIADLSLLPVMTIASELSSRLGRTIGELSSSRHVWMLLFDGLSGQEDFLTPFFASHAPRLPLVGGSFGDEEDFGRVTMVHDGTVFEGAGAVLLLEYNRPFQVLHHTHMQLSEQWYRVTSTARGGRLLRELDNRPAKRVYAEALGIDLQDLAGEITSQRPLGTRFRGRAFPCSIMNTEPEGFLLAYSVQVGDRLCLLSPLDIVDESATAMKRAVERLTADGGVPHGALLFHCLGRYLEGRQNDVLLPLFDALNQLPLAGLNTYGEQFGGRHMNHSLTGILFG